MATFHQPQTTPSPAASRLLHPAAQPTPILGTDVLAEIAAGLARTIDSGAAGSGRCALLATPAYEASMEVVAANGCQVVDGAKGLPVSLAVVTGQLLVWTADDGTEVLAPGGLCSIEGGERIQLVNVGPDPAAVVLVQALDESRAGDTAALLPCSALAGR